MEAFFEILLEVEKCIMCGSIQVLPNQISEKSSHTFEDIDLQGSVQKTE